MNTQSVILVKITAHKWGGRVKDTKASTKLANASSADDGRIAVIKRLLPVTAAAKLSAADRSLYSAVHSVSLPFEDGGWRVMRNARYMDLKNEIAALTAKRDAVVDELLGRWDEVRALAQKELGSLYDDKEFPSRENAKRKFGVSFNKRPVPGGDIRLEGLDAAEVAKIKAQCAADVQESIQNALGTIIDDLQNMVHGFMTSIDGKLQNSLYYRKQQETCRRVCASLREVNLFGDPAIDDAIASVERVIMKFDPQELRKGEDVRQFVKQELTEVEKALNSITF